MAVTQAATITIDLGGFSRLSVVEVQTLADADLAAVNTRDDQFRVAMRVNTSWTTTGPTMTLVVPPVSWSAVELALDS